PALLVSAALVAVAALLVASLRGEPPSERPTSLAAGGRRVLAILPFANLTGDPGNTYLGEGLTEDLITRLGRRYSRKLAVIAPASVRGYGENLPPVDEIGRKLGADYILQGSIRRGAGRLRVTAQLVRARDRTDLWATNYDRPLDDPIEVQSEVSKRISEALALQILDPGDREGLRAAALPAAYDKYLRGRHLLHGHRKGDAEAALADLQAAVAIDPAFARGWSSLALALRQQDLPRDEIEPKARAAALKALSLDDSDEEAWLTLAMIRFYNDLDPEGAKIAFERAIESQPDYAEAYHHFAAYWSIRGEHDKAIASVQHALALDPLSPAVNADVGWYFYYARRYDEAIAASKRTLEISPRYVWAHRSLILSCLAKGDDRSALEAARNEMAQRGAPADEIAAVDPDHPGPGLKAYWLWDLRRWDAASVREKAQPAVVGLIYASLGYRDAALFTLEKACDARSGWMTPFLRVDPLADPLRSDPRFQSLMKRLDTIASVRASLWSSAAPPPGGAARIAAAAKPAGRGASRSRPVVYP
ncbi:MAG TPA: hypothetical protein VNI57_04955, partial [Candidatus Saccharimonadales bacterium]|nr:hypothetical protein [Candidatus Saccharimonadales bacterium]